MLGAFSRRFELLEGFGAARGLHFGALWRAGGGRGVLGRQPALAGPGVLRGLGCAGRGGSLQLNGGRVEPVESGVGLGEVEPPAPCGPD